MGGDMETLNLADGALSDPVKQAPLLLGRLQRQRQHLALLQRTTKVLQPIMEMGVAPQLAVLALAAMTIAVTAKK